MPIVGTGVMKGESAAGDWTTSPDSAFATLSNETRLQILRALGEEREPLSFSELRNRVGTRDSGQFNYHLDQLTDQFVRSTADGYVITWSGRLVVRGLISAGTVTARPTIEPTVIDVDCPLCGAPVEIRYRDHLLKARCTRCRGIREHEVDGYLFAFSLPPAGLEDRRPAEAFRATVTNNLVRLTSFRNDVCPHCSAPVDETLDVCSSHDASAPGTCPRCGRHHPSWLALDCTRCSAGIRCPGSVVVQADPVVTTFCQRQGIEHRFATWASLSRGLGTEAELVGTDPIHLRLLIPGADDRLRLTVDEALAVVDADRVDAGANPAD